MKHAVVEDQMSVDPHRADPDRGLGYDRFGDARREARGLEPWGSPLSAGADRAGTIDARDRLSPHLARDVQNLSRTLGSLAPDALDEAIRLLVGARRIWVVGFRNSHALAHYARNVLTTLKPNVRLAPGPALDVAQELAGVSDRDVWCWPSASGAGRICSAACSP